MQIFKEFLRGVRLSRTSFPQLHLPGLTMSSDKPLHDIRWEYTTEVEQVARFCQREFHGIMPMRILLQLAIQEVGVHQ
ncbi:MAG: hypothetical protein WA705_17515 [Candidatus Ozemobacteraceae bacterium]